MLVFSDDADADGAEGRYDKCIKVGMKALLIVSDADAALVMMLMLIADTTSHNGIKAGMKIFGLMSLILMLLLLVLILLPAMFVCLFQEKYPG